jgi:hypothetical protein
VLRQPADVGLLPAFHMDLGDALGVVGDGGADERADRSLGIHVGFIAHSRPGRNSPLSSTTVSMRQSSK